MPSGPGASSAGVLDKPYNVRAAPRQRTGLLRDTDFSGFVYRANDLCFLERRRTEFLRAHAITQSILRREEAGLVFVVSRFAIDYVRRLARAAIDRAARGSAGLMLRL